MLARPGREALRPEICEQWVVQKGLPELGFTLGGLDELPDPDVRLMAGSTTLIEYRQ